MMANHGLARRRGPLDRAVVLARAHSQVVSTSFHAGGGRAAADLVFRVNLASEFQRCGESRSGVRSTEPVRFHFPRDYPMQAPELSLRDDFSRNHPHMQPWLIDGRPVPCIYDGNLRELLHHEGFVGLLNQTAVWLDRAADGTLIDSEQGWEPVRRDSCDALLVADADALRDLTSHSGGYRFFRLSYFQSDRTDRYIVGSISRRRLIWSNRTPLGSVVSNGSQMSLALVVWPRPGPSCRAVTCDTYLPETVDSVGALRRRATEYHCLDEFDDGLVNLKWRLSTHWQPGSFVLAVVLLAHRPYHLVGSQSSIELCPYVVDVAGPDHFARGDATPVRPAAHHDPVSRPLLVQMSGGDSKSPRVRWTLIGAGSLGSKIAMHLARAGHGPDVVVDNAGMSPHNAARHALLPCIGTKADRLCQSLREFDQISRPVVVDAGTTSAFKPQNGVWSKDSWGLVNTTGSVAVHNSLSASRAMKIRAVEVSLFGGGRVGIISVEGPGRNPNAGALMAEFYAKVADDETLREGVFGDDSQTAWQPIGQGCGSLTMSMSDGRVSLFAASMAEYLLARQRDELPSSGKLLIGRLADNGLGIRWKDIDMPQVTVVDASLDGEPWSIHVHSRADVGIQEEMYRCDSVETGGVLIGSISETSRTVHVVDVVDAPDDSVRKTNEFVLGTRGLIPRLEALSNTADYSLYCLGTWHSHLSEKLASETDRATARAVSLARLTPSLFLIRRTDGYSAILGDAADDPAIQEEDVRTC